MMSTPQHHHAVGSVPALEHATWRKSSYSQGAGAECVELAQKPDLIGFRDSKDPHGPRLVVHTATARTVIDAIKAGAHDLP